MIFYLLSLTVNKAKNLLTRLIRSLTDVEQLVDTILDQSRHGDKLAVTWSMLKNAMENDSYGYAIEYVALNKELLNVTGIIVNEILTIDADDGDAWKESLTFQAMSVLDCIFRLPYNHVGVVKFQNSRVNLALKNWIDRDNPYMSSWAWGMLAHMLARMPENEKDWFSSNVYVALALEKMNGLNDSVDLAIWGYLVNVAAHRRLSNQQLLNLTKSEINRDQMKATSFAWSFLYNFSRFDASAILKDTALVCVVAATARKDGVFQFKAMQILQFIKLAEYGGVDEGGITPPDLWFVGPPQSQSIGLGKARTRLVSICCLFALAYKVTLA